MTNFLFVRNLHQSDSHQPILHLCRLTVVAVLTILFLFPCHARSASDKLQKLKGLTIEELMEVEFFKLRRRPENPFESSAAVYVLNNTDLQRIGSNLIPDALRFVPGIQVAQSDANSWALTIRGFSGISRGLADNYANKLLVLNDGRSVYNPLFSGVWWDSQDVLLHDIERVEVIRGPGASLWGSNAVNGIINIISKNSEKTQGGFFSAGAGTEHQTFAHFRYGNKLGNNSFFRIYGKYLNVANQVDSSGTETNDGWHVFRGGFRTDTNPGNKDNITLQGEYYNGRAGQDYNVVTSTEPPFLENLTFDAEMQGANLLGRWTHQFSNRSELILQTYYDYTKRNEAIVRGRINTFDVDFQHRFPLGSRQEIIYGGGFRNISDKFDSTFTFLLTPSQRQYQVYNIFAQDQIALSQKLLYLTLGTKYEHNDFSGAHLLPNARLSWLPSRNHTVWAASSWAVRTPSRSENDMRVILSGFPPSNDLIVLWALVGNQDMRAEELWSSELGYRVRATQKLLFDVTTFYNQYHWLRTNESRESVVLPDTTFLAILQADNLMDGKTYGFEIAADWLASDRIKFKAGYSFLKMDLQIKNEALGSNTLDEESIPGQSPVNQLFLRSAFDLHRTVELDLNLRYVDSLPSLAVDQYLQADLRLAWRFHPNLQFVILGRNLLTDHYQQMTQNLDPTNENTEVFPVSASSDVQRSIAVKLNASF